MITLSIITELVWNILRAPYHIWRMNWKDLSYADRNGFKIVFASYGLVILAILIAIIA